MQISRKPSRTAEPAVARTATAAGISTATPCSAAISCVKSNGKPCVKPLWTLTLKKQAKFQKENFVGKLDLVTKKEFEILKKLLEKQQKEINKLKKNRFKKAKKS